MKITIDAPNKSVNIIFSLVEWDVLVWARQRFGATVLRDWLKDWLRTRWRLQEQERLNTLANTEPEELK